MNAFVETTVPAPRGVAAGNIIPRWVSAYVGIPYADGGLDPKGCHCWGLVRLVLSRQAGVEVPKYGPVDGRELLAAFAGEKRGGTWAVVNGARTVFDVVSMTHRENGRPIECHCGIMVSRRHLLHIEKHTAAIVVPVSDQTVCHRIVGTYRHRALAA